MSVCPFFVKFFGEKTQKNHGFPRGFSILSVNGLISNQRVSLQGISEQVAPVHIHGAKAGIFIGGVVINPPVGVDAGGIAGDLVATIRHLHAAPLLRHCTKNVEELADASLFRFCRHRIQFYKRRTDKPGR